MYETLSEKLPITFVCVLFQSVWRQHFCDNELKSLILQDVVRTFPDELYFREKDVQDLMVRDIFTYYI